MLYSVEKSIQEHVVLLRISKLVFVLHFETLHQLTELVLVEDVLAVGVAFHNLVQRGQETVFSLLIVNGNDWTLQKVHYEFCSPVDWDLVIGFEMEKQSSENVSVRDSVVQKWVDVVVRESGFLELGLLGINLWDFLFFFLFIGHIQ